VTFIFGFNHSHLEKRGYCQRCANWCNWVKWHLQVESLCCYFIGIWQSLVLYFSFHIFLKGHFWWIEFERLIVCLLTESTISGTAIMFLEGCFTTQHVFFREVNSIILDRFWAADYDSVLKIFAARHWSKMVFSVIYKSSDLES
jgi:hypothetical protein